MHTSVFPGHSYCQEIIAQLEIPEAKIIEGNGEEITNASEYIVFEDPDFGYSIDYPASWQVSDEGLQAYNLVNFMSPDFSSAVSVKLLPRIEDQSLKEYGDENFKENDNFQLTEYYRNSTTKLGGLPALVGAGTLFNTINIYQEAMGQQSQTTRTYQVWGLSEDRDGFYGVMHSGYLLVSIIDGVFLILKN